MKFFRFSQYLQKLEQTSSRLDMTEQLADLFSELDASEIPEACYLMQGQLVPRYKSLEFNMSDKLTIRALAQFFSQVDDNNQLPDTNLFQEKDDSLYRRKIKKIYKKKGDLGQAAQELYQELTNDREIKKEADILRVYKDLVAIAQDEGTGSQDRKINQTANLFKNLQPLSIRYVVRIINGKLRLGFSTMTMLDALSWVQHQDKSDRKQLEQAYNKRADIGQLAQGYLAAKNDQKIKDFLQSYQVEVNTPVVPALCQRLNSAAEIVEKMGEVYAEPKYDGLRAQIHIDKSQPHTKYQVYTRNMDNVTHMFPELESCLDQFQCQSCILDAEAIAYNSESGKLLPFQKTITRKRKHGVADQAESVPIRFYIFDVLSRDKESLVDVELQKRRKVLSNLIKENQTLRVTDYIITKDAEKLRQFHEEQLGEGLEGAVMKKLSSPYRGGRKGWRWVKIKEMEGSRGKLSDTLDCVVMGYYRGKGKRAQFGIGAFLVGVLDKEEKETEVQVKTIAKIGTGLTDDQFKKIKNMADAVAIDEKPDQYDVPADLKPDVWIYPEIVVEIAADELTESPTHTAGQALRFPRLVKFRQDKTWEQATTIKELFSIKVK